MSHSQPAADLVAIGGRIYTVNPAQPWASAVAVRDGRITYVGDDIDAREWIGSETTVVELHGAFVLPGLVESHVHILLGAVTSSGIQFEMNDTVSEVQRKVREFIRDHPERPAVFGFGYDADMFDERGPHRALLDDVSPDVPVILLDHTLHGGWANSRALEVTGVGSGTPDPLPSVYLRDVNGSPTGAIKGSGATVPIVLATGAITVDAVADAIAGVVEGMSAYGFTAAFDMGNPVASRTALDALRSLDHAGRLPMRVSATTMINTPHMAEIGIEEQRECAELYRSPHVWLDTVKIVADSVINNQTAAMLDPYVTTGERGSLYFSADVLLALVRDAAAMGHGTVIHTLGDRAVREGLGVAQALKDAGDAGTRLVLTHCEVVAPEDVPRFAQLGVMVQTTSNWALSTPGHAYHLGAQRNDAHRQPMRSITDSGAVLALGADWPATPGGFEWGMNPFVNLFTAMHRKPPAGLEDALGASSTPLSPADEVLTLEQAIAGYTIEGAKVMGRDRTFGSIDVGKSADMIVLDRDLFAVPADEIPHARVLVTMFEGRVVHDALLGIGEDKREQIGESETVHMTAHCACQ